MEPSWKQADVFPVIAGIIEQAYRELQRFVTAQEIAERLLQDSEGRNLVEAAREQQHDQQSLEWLASNMVAWFSQRITVGESDWARAFERTIPYAAMSETSSNCWKFSVINEASCWEYLVDKPSRTSWMAA